MSTFITIFSLVIFLACVLTNLKRGLAKSLGVVIACVISLVFSVKISNEYSENFYEKFLEERIIEYISEKSENFDSAKIINENLFKESLGITSISDETIRQTLLLEGKISENLVNLAKKENSGVDTKEILEYIDKNSFFNDNEASDLGIFSKTNTFETAVRILANKDNSTRSKAFYNEIVKPCTVTVVRYTMAVVLFLIIFGVLKFVILKINILEKIPVANLLNALLGGVLGAIEGLIIITILKNLYEQEIFQTLILLAKHLLNI